MDQKQFDELMAKRKRAQGSTSTVSDDSGRMGIVEETLRGLGRAPVNIVSTPLELFDAARGVMDQAGDSFAGAVLGQDPQKRKQLREQEEVSRDSSFRRFLSPDWYAKKGIQAADEVKSSGMLKPSDATSKKWREGISDPNWWAGNVSEAISYSGIMAKMAHSAIKKQGTEQIKVLASKSASKEARKKARKEIGKIGSRAVMAKSAALGAAMSHADYRNWKKENPEDATVIGDMVGMLGGGIAGSVEGWTIGSHLIGPFAKKFGMGEGAKASASFWKEFLKAAPKGIIKEGSTEAVQTLIENTGAKLGYDDDVDLMEGIAESAIIGGAVGGGFGIYEGHSATAGKDALEKNKLSIKKTQKRITVIKDEIEKYNNILAVEDPNSPKYKRAQAALEKANLDLARQENYVDAFTEQILSEGGTEKDIPLTDEEIFGTTVDPSLTIEEIASGVDNGDITKEMWESTPKDNYTDEQIAAVDEHINDYENDIAIQKMANGEALKEEQAENILDGTGEETIFSTLGEEFTDEEAIDAFNSDLKISHGDKAPTAALSTKQPDPVVSELSDILGVRLVPMSLPKGGHTINGAVRPGGSNIIYMNENTKRPAMWVLGHEYGHSLEGTNPEAYESLLKIAAAEVDQVKLKEYRLQMDKNFGLKQGTTSQRAAMREMLGDFMGDKFNDKKFWDKVHKDNPSRFKQIVDSLKQFIADVMSKFTGTGTKSDKFFNDIVKLDETLTKVINEHVGYTDAIQAVTKSDVPTGDIVDLNADNKHWTHIPIGEEGRGSMVLRETSDKIYLKVLSRPGSARGTGNTTITDDTDKGAPTAALEELQKHAKETGKTIVAEARGNHPYMVGMGFKVKDDRDMTWEPTSEIGKAGAPVVEDVHVDAEAGANAVEYELERTSLEEEVTKIEEALNPTKQGDKPLTGPEKGALRTQRDNLKKSLKDLATDRARAVKIADTKRLEAKAKILDLEKQIKYEIAFMSAATDRETVKQANENITTLNEQVSDLQKEVNRAEEVIGTDITEWNKEVSETEVDTSIKGMYEDIEAAIAKQWEVVNTSTDRAKVEEAGDKIVELQAQLLELEELSDYKGQKQVSGDKQKGRQVAGDTQDTTESKETDSSDRDKQGKKEIPKLADKIKTVKQEESYKKGDPVEMNLKKIVDNLAKKGMQGNPGAFMEAVINMDVDVQTVQGEAAYQKAFRNHMIGEENEPAPVKKIDAKYSTKQLDAWEKQKQKREYKAKQKTKLAVLNQMLADKGRNISPETLGPQDMEKDSAKIEARVNEIEEDYVEEKEFNDRNDRVQEMKFSIDPIDPNEVFTSNINKAIDEYKLETKLPNSLPASEWIGLFNKLGKKGKIPIDEFNFSFAKDMMEEMRDESMTRKEVMSMFQMNPITIKGAPKYSSNSEIEARNTIDSYFQMSQNHGFNRVDNFVNVMTKKANDQDSDTVKKLVTEAVERSDKPDYTQEQKVNAFINDEYGSKVYDRLKADATDYDNWLMGVKKEYEEIFDEALEDRAGLGGGYQQMDAYTIADEWLRKNHDLYPEDLEDSPDFAYSQMNLPGAGDNYFEYLIKDSSSYTGTGAEHWGGEQGTIAHMRGDIFGAPDASDRYATALMLYEIQSDRHSDIAKKGTYNIEEERATRTEINELQSQITNEKNESKQADLIRKANDLEDSIIKMRKKPEDAPFSKTWPLLVFKHAAIKAYNEGTEYIAWPSTFEQMNQVEGWGARKEGKRHKPIMDHYLKTMPRLVNNFMKEYGGKVEEITIDGGHKVQAVKMTPALKETIRRKQVMQFSVDPEEPIDPKDPHEHVQKNILKSKTIDRRTFTQSLKNWTTATWKSMTSIAAELRPNEYGYLKDRIRLAKEVDKFGSRQAFSKIYSVIGKLNEDERQVFTMNLILSDILRDTIPNKHGVVILDGSNLPFGYRSVDEVRTSLRHFREQAKKSPKIAHALATRRKVMSEIQSNLIDEGFLPKALRGNDAYFHHQTLEKLTLGDDYLFGIQRRAGDKPLSWSHERSGGDVDSYSTDYVVSEFGVISNAIAALELQRIKKEMKAVYDIKPSLESKQGAQFEVPKGYVKWSPNKHQGWGVTPSYPDKVTTKVLEDNKIDPKILELVKEASGAKEEWVIPEKMASALSRIREISHDAMPAKVSNAFTQAWKKWMLMNPFRVVRYNINNMSGDVDIAMAYDPKILKYGFQSMKDLAGDINSSGLKLPFNMQKFGTKLSEAQKKELDVAHRLGVIGAGFVMHEVADVAAEFEALMRGPQGNAVKKFGMNWWQGSKDATNYRENILRLATYRYFKDRIASGEKNVYGASNPMEVDEITDPNEKAAKLSRELIGDYGRLSEGGEWMRKHVIPFYSWMEINAPRYVRMMRNLKHEKKGAAGVAQAGIGMGWKGSVLAAKFTAFSALVSLWNNTFFGDDEEELQGYQKTGMHILLGRRDDGTIRYLPIAGAFRDALSWFDGEDIEYDIEEMMNGEATISSKLKEAGQALYRKPIMGARPFFKMVGEVQHGTTLFPEGEPRPIRDKFDHVAKSMSLEMFTRRMQGLPTKGIGGDIQNKLYWNVDPKESAYYAIREKVNKFNELKGYVHRQSRPSEKSNALYYYKQALRWADLEMAEKWLNEYYEMGGTYQGAQSSYTLTMPTGGLRKKDKSEFYRTLSKEDKVLLNTASKWYRQTYKPLIKGH